MTKQSTRRGQFSYNSPSCRKKETRKLVIKTVFTRDHSANFEFQKLDFGLNSLTRPEHQVLTNQMNTIPTIRVNPESLDKSTDDDHSVQFYRNRETEKKRVLEKLFFRQSNPIAFHGQTVTYGIRAKIG
jgi:hypothetical protein